MEAEDYKWAKENLTTVLSVENPVRIKIGPERHYDIFYICNRIFTFGTDIWINRKDFDIARRSSATKVCLAGIPRSIDLASFKRISKVPDSPVIKWVSKGPCSEVHADVIVDRTGKKQGFIWTDAMGLQTGTKVDEVSERCDWYRGWMINTSGEVFRPYQDPVSGEFLDRMWTRFCGPEEFKG